ncbi:MAG: hypothetical protein GX283_03960 [Clostridiaceae bacterium]|nr:hypothetical protein [Clostridiaceae bacterium]
MWETGCAGNATYLDYVTGRTCYAVPHFGAVSSVACLEWSYRDNGSDVLV